MAESTGQSLRELQAAARSARQENLRRSLYRFRSNALSMIGLAILLFILFIAIAAPLLVPFPEDSSGATHFMDRLLPPGPEHPFGTDKVGRDIFSRVLMGTGLALQVGVVIIVLATTIGVTVGGVAAYFGGSVDDLLMRITDIFLTVPALVLAIAFSAALGKGIINAMIGISLVWWPGFARLTRSLVLSLREEAFVEAAYGIGASHGRILFRHILPNAVSPIIIKMTTDFRFRGADCRRARLYRHRRAAAHPGMGRDDRGRASLFPGRMVGRDLPGHGHLVAGLQLESAGRRPARRP